MLYEEPRVQNLWVHLIMMAITIVFSLVSMFFLPVDFAALKMSLDPGFTIFFVLVLAVFLVKIFNIADFYLVLFMGTNSMNTFHYIILGMGAFLVGGSLVIVIIEILILTQDFWAVVSHPFFIDFALFMLNNIFAFLHIFLYSPTMSPYQYAAVQPEQIEYPAMPMPQEFVLPQFPFQPQPPTQPQPPVQPQVQAQPQPAVAQNRAFIPYYVSK